MARLDVSANLNAFLDMIAVSEGTAHLGDDGYNVIVGGKLFDSYADHPRTLVYIRRINDHSSAAGRYQFVKRTWDDLARRLKLPDFSPECQDRAAIALLHQCKAVELIEAGAFTLAVIACKRIWASLPGAGYGQHENNMEKLVEAYRRAGGTVSVA